MIKFLILIFLIFSCQPLPKDVPLEKYRNQFIEGQVLFDDSLKGKVPKGDYFLIISVRDLENPMPIAVLRVKKPKFPYHFKITGRHKLNHYRITESRCMSITAINLVESMAVSRYSGSVKTL